MKKTVRNYIKAKRSTRQKEENLKLLIAKVKKEIEELKVKIIKRREESGISNGRRL